MEGDNPIRGVASYGRSTEKHAMQGEIKVITARYLQISSRYDFYFALHRMFLCATPVASYAPDWVISLHRLRLSREVKG